MHSQGSTRIDDSSEESCEYGVARALRRGRRRPRPTPGSRRAPASRPRRRRMSAPPPPRRPAAPPHPPAAPRPAACTARARGACSAPGDRRRPCGGAGNARSSGISSARRPRPIGTEHPVARDLDGPVGPGDDRHAHDLRRPRRRRLLQHALRAVPHRDPHDERVFRRPVARAHRRRAPRSPTRSHPARCAADRRCATPTRRANRRRARVEPPIGHRRGRIGDERHVLHERERAGLADHARRRSPARPAPDRAPTGTRGRRDASPPRPRPRRACVPPRPRRARTASRTRRADPPRTLRSRAPRACRAESRSSPRRPHRMPSASANDVNACGIPSRSARRCVRARSRPTSACTVKPALRSAGTCTRHPNPVPTTAAPGTQ